MKSVASVEEKVPGDVEVLHEREGLHHRFVHVVRDGDQTVLEIRIGEFWLEVAMDLARAELDIRYRSNDVVEVRMVQGTVQIERHQRRVRLRKMLSRQGPLLDHLDVRDLDLMSGAPYQKTVRNIVLEAVEL